MLQRRRIASDQDRRLLRDRQRLRRGLLPEDVAGIADRSGTGRRLQPAVNPVLESDVQRRTSTTAGSPSRRTCLGSRRPTSVGSATAPPAPDVRTRRRARTSIRSTAPGTTARSAASGSSAGPTSRERPTHSAATPPPSSVRCCSSITRDRDSPRSTAPMTSDRCCPATRVRGHSGQRREGEDPRGVSSPSALKAEATAGYIRRLRRRLLRQAPLIASSGGIVQ